MIMEIAHTGRTGKDTSITFDTDNKIFCYGREWHEVYIYAEQTRDVIGVVDNLINIGFKEVSVEEFKKTTNTEYKQYEISDDCGKSWYTRWLTKRELDGARNNFWIVREVEA